MSDADTLRRQKGASTDPDRLEREACRLEAAADLRRAIEWARGQADIWRSRPANEEPARSYMARHYTRLADAAERSIEPAALTEMPPFTGIAG